MNEEQIRDEARKAANRSQFMSNHIYDHKSYEDGFYEGMNQALHQPPVNSSVRQIETKMKDADIMKLFFDMLKRNGVNVIEEFDEGKEWTIISRIPVGGIGNEENRTLTFCSDNDGNYWRIMGFIGTDFTDEIHK